MHKRKRWIAAAAGCLCMLCCVLTVKSVWFPSEATARSRLAGAIQDVASLQGQLSGTLSQTEAEVPVSVTYDGSFAYVPGMTSRAQWSIGTSVDGSEGKRLTDCEAYWQEGADQLFVRSNEEWTAYQNASLLLSSDWWNQQASAWTYEGEVSYQGRSYGCLSHLYEQEELSELFRYVPLFPYGTADTSQGAAQLSLLFSVTTGRPVVCELSFVLEDPMLVAYPGRTVSVTDGSFQFLFTDTSEVDPIAVPEDARSVEPISMGLLFGEAEVSNDRHPEGLTSPDGKWQAGFLTHPIYDVQTLSDGILSVQPSQGLSGNPSWTFSFEEHPDVYTDFVSDRNTALVYYNEQEGVSDVAVSDVMQSSIGAYPCYWYSQQYSDAQGFVYQAYRVCVDLSDGIGFTGTLSAMTDLGVSVALSDTGFLDLLSSIWVEEVDA